MKTITLTLTEEQAQQLLQQLLDPNNGNSYRIETAKEEEIAAQRPPPVYTHKAMDSNGVWWKYTSTPRTYTNTDTDFHCWITDADHALCLPSEIPADFTGDWKDSLMPM